MKYNPTTEKSMEESGMDRFKNFLDVEQCTKDMKKHYPPNLKNLFKFWF